MIKTVVTPHTNNIQLSIPDNYIGKEIEVLIFAVDEVVEMPVIESPIKDASRFKGILTDEEGEKYHEYLRQGK